MKMETKIIMLSLISLNCFVVLNTFESICVSESHPLHNIYYVPGNFTSIQKAIDEVPSGSIIFVSGYYAESLSIDKEISLIGTGNFCVLQNENALKTIEVRADNVKIANFFITTSISEAIGIYLYRVSCVTIENNTIINHRHGIYLRYSSYNFLNNNSLINNHIGIHIYDSTGNTLKSNVMVGNDYNLRIWGLPLEHFIHNIDATNTVNGKPVYYLVNKNGAVISNDAGFIGVINSSNIVIYNVQVTNNLAGIIFAYTNNSMIWNSSFTYNERGIYLISSHNNFIVENELGNNFWSGLSLVASFNNTIASNKIWRNKYGLYFAVGAYYISNGFAFTNCNSVLGNFIEQNSFGMYFENSSNNVVKLNDWINNTVGIAFDKSKNNLFYENNFLNNTLEIDFDSLSANYWDNGTIGNYWYKYASVDNDGNGVWDDPYKLNSINIDNFPRVRPFSRPYFSVNISYSPETLRVSQNVKFSAFSSGNVTILLWWFIDCDGVHISSEFVTAFQKAGNYTVMLFALNDEGFISQSAITFKVEKLNVSLIPSFPSSCFIGENFSITVLLVDETNCPLSGLTLRFYLLKNASRVLVGEDKTGDDGKAQLTMVFREQGKKKFEIEFEGNEKYEKAYFIGFVEVLPSVDILMVGMITAVILFLCVFIKLRKRFVVRRRLDFPQSQFLRTSIKILSLLTAFSLTLGPLLELATIFGLSPVLASNLLVVPYDYPKIQDAINNCSSRSTILIKKGYMIYVEPIFINKSVKIIGENKAFTIIETPRHVDTITIEANNVILEGLTIRNQMNYTRYGIKVHNAVNVTISSNVIENHFVGVKLENSESVTICNNLIQRNRYEFSCNGLPAIQSLMTLLFRIFGTKLWRKKHNI